MGVFRGRRTCSSGMLALVSQRLHFTSSQQYRPDGFQLGLLIERRVVEMDQLVGHVLLGTMMGIDRYETALERAVAQSDHAQSMDVIPSTFVVVRPILGHGSPRAQGGYRRWPSGRHEKNARSSSAQPCPDPRGCF